MQKLTPVAAKKYMDEYQSLYIIDVREQEELEEGYIPNSILIPLDTLKEAVPEKIKDEKANIFVYCRSGKRSRQAAEILEKLGYVNVYDIGGIIDWPFELIL